VFLGRALREHPRPAPLQAERVIVALGKLASEETSAGVRAKALEALSRADAGAAARELARLARTLSGVDAAMSARALAISPVGGAEVLELVQACFDGKGRRLDEAALEVLLGEGYGPSLAEAERGGLDERSRRPLSQGGRDPSPRIRVASALAFQGFLARAQFLGFTERAEDVAKVLASEVVDPARVLQASAQFTLTAGADPARALAFLTRWIALLEPVDATRARARFDLAVAHTLCAAAQLARGEPIVAAAELALARTLLAGLAAENLERGGDAGAELAVEVAGERAVVESYALLALLRGGRAVDAPECQAIARALHELSLRAQLLSTVGVLTSWTGDLDTLFQHPHGPFDLLLGNPALERGLGAHPLDLKLSLARAVAAVVPDELPGFGTGQSAPLDETRAGLSSQIEDERLKQVERELRRLTPDAPERANLETAYRVLSSQSEPEPDLHRLRLPSALAIELAGDLREEGRPQEASALAASAKEALSRSDFLFAGAYVQELVARAESILGSCATDEGDPQAADKILRGALARLETIAADGNDDLRSKAARSSVLVSLAVNANVKLREPAKALAYFERAFELRQDDFTRTLLACYRARAGRGDEARALLREMPESPYNYYNIACTYALLGDAELALEYLTRDLRAGKKSAAAILRQKVWARADPDLARLRDDPRFTALVGK
ncbi:MAG TPA: hypothetical protein VM509_08425, partial [Planctomycetota bacterium]|nr:hypothetical protein [Planctomycetota bacterium]